MQGSTRSTTLLASNFRIGAIFIGKKQLESAHFFNGANSSLATLLLIRLVFLQTLHPPRCEEWEIPLWCKARCLFLCYISQDSVWSPSAAVRYATLVLILILNTKVWDQFHNTFPLITSDFLRRESKECSTKKSSIFPYRFPFHWKHTEMGCCLLINFSFHFLKLFVEKNWTHGKEILEGWQRKVFYEIGPFNLKMYY